MRRWSRFRAAVLLALFAASIGVLAKAFLAPGPLERPLAAFAFPAASPVEGWRAGFSDDPLEAFYRADADGSPIAIRLRFIADLRFLHFSNPDLVERMLPAGDLALDVGMRYMVDAEGRIETNERGMSLPRSQLVIAHPAPFDYHGFWEDGRAFHLSALIGSNGRTAATSRQLLGNIYMGQFRTESIGRWLLGESVLPDKRCVLADISLLAADLPRDEARKRLEKAWDAWRGWCAPAFAELCKSTN